MTTTRILTSTQVLRDRDGGRVPAGRYIWRGAAGQPVFRFADSRDIVTADVDVIVETPCSSVFLCERTRRGPGIHPSTNHKWQNVRVYGNGKAERGIWARPTIDENNEHFTIADCVFYGCARPIVFGGQQSKHHAIRDTVFETFDVAVTSDSGFTWSGKTAAVGKVACELTRVGDPVSIRDVGIETVGRVLVTAGPTTASQSVVLDSVRYEADQLHPDGHAIVMRHAGTLTMRGGRYGGGKQPIPRIALLGVGDQSVNLDGVTFGAFGAHAVKPIVAQNPDEAQVSYAGVVFQRVDGDPANTMHCLSRHEFLVAPLTLLPR